MSSSGSRLASERKRLGHSQEAFGLLGGVKRAAQVNYEKDRRHPDSEYLSLIAAEGADVQYILTGIRSVNIKDATEEHAGYDVPRAEDQQDESSTEASALSPRDEVWLKIGRQLSEADRARLQEIGTALVSARHVKDEEGSG
ncbi:MAG: helix-turn-helix transcriptional regulator [Candidatus Sedimenticola sp. (ex Thyasira tokunagai)]